MEFFNFYFSSISTAGYLAGAAATATVVIVVVVVLVLLIDMVAVAVVLVLIILVVISKRICDLYCGYANTLGMQVIFVDLSR
jgi:hypothetical protein